MVPAIGELDVALIGRRATFGVILTQVAEARARTGPPTSDFNATVSRRATTTLVRAGNALATPSIEDPGRLTPCVRFAYIIFADPGAFAIVPTGCAK
jgi:hypothetical protein